MLSPDGKIQGVLVATGVKTLMGGVLVGSWVEVCRNVEAGVGVALGASIATVLERIGFAGPQAVRRMQKIGKMVRFILYRTINIVSLPLVLAHYPQLTRHIAQAFHASIRDDHVIFDAHPVALRQVDARLDRVSHARLQ